jgi:sulfur carrier protein
MPETLSPLETRLRLNDLTLPCPPGLSLAALLDAQGIEAAAVATAVNGTFVPRSLRARHTLHPGDTVLTFQAIVGG